VNQRSIAQALDTVDWGLAPPLNPHYPGLHRDADPWLDSVGLADKPGRLDKHRRIAVPLFASMAYPTASRDHLLLAHDWMAWLFEYDDQFDEGDDGHSTERARRSRESLLSLLASTAPARDVPRRTLHSGLSDIWSRLRAVSPPGLCERFAGHVADYLESYEWETHNRRVGYCPDVEEYLAKRQHTGAAHPCFDLVVPAAGIQYERVDWTNPRRGRLEYLSSEIITLANDLVSFPKERVQGDVHNIVIILMRRQGLSESQAVHRSVEWVRERIRDFEREARALVSASPDLHDDTQRYVHGLKVWYLANYFWSLKCRRFLLDGEER
jgi:hypothetical protein